MIKRLLFGLGFCLCAVPAFAFPSNYTCSRNFYVATTGTDGSGCGTSTSNACATLPGAQTNIALQAGDCVNVADGNYNWGAVGISKGGNANTATGYVVYRSMNLHGAVLGASGISYPSPFFEIDTPFVIVDGFEMNGNYFGAGATPGSNTAHDGFDTPENHSNPPHHVKILDNLMHDISGSCVAWGEGGDYTIIAGNICHDAVNYTPYPFDGSCYSIYQPFSVGVNSSWPDDNQTYHIQLLNNIGYNCQEKQTSTTHKDGNGLIIDTLLTYSYPYGILVSGNVMYHNGGRGVYSFGSPGNVLFTNNVAYDNGLDTVLGTGNGNCEDVCSNGNTWQNNICYATGTNGNIAIVQNQSYGDGTHCPTTETTTTSWTHNISFNGRNGQASDSVVNNNPSNSSYVSTFNSNNTLLGTDPMVVNASGHDFHLLNGSPAIAAGASVPIRVTPAGTFPLTTDGMAFNSPPDIGAYREAGGPL